MYFNLSWDDLKYFNAIARECSLRNAADALKISAATLSRRLVSLEEKFGEPLFHRKPTGLELTSLGLEVLSHVENARDALTIVEKRCIAPNQKNKIRISAPSDHIRNLIVPTLGRFREQIANVNFIVSTRTHNNQEVDRYYDLIIADSDYTLPNFFQNMLASKELWLCRAGNAPNLNKLVMWDQATPERISINSILRDLFPEAQAAIEVDDVGAYIEAVAAGFGFGLLCPKDTSKHPKADVVIFLEKISQFNFAILTNEIHRSNKLLNEIKNNIYDISSQ